MPLTENMSMSIDPSLAAFIALTAFCFAVYFLHRTSTASSRIRDRLALPHGTGAGKSGSSYEGNSVTGLLENVGKRAEKLMPTSEAAQSALHKRLIQAGYFSKSAPYWYTGSRFLCLIGPQLLLLGIWPNFFGHLSINYMIYSSLGLAIVGFIGPSFFLDKRIGKRQDEYRDGFPDMMDLLVACVEAGLSLDASVGRVSEELTNRYPDLADHLKILTLELRAGRSRQDAWSNLAERLGIDEARALSTMLRQSEELGTSIGQTLRVFSDEMREKRMLTAEEKALALPAKLVVPLILFVFPSLLGVLLLPAIVRMIWVMGATN